MKKRGGGRRRSAYRGMIRREGGMKKSLWTWECQTGRRRETGERWRKVTGDMTKEEKGKKSETEY